ncbi:MAG: PQQ-binding-like beta-propeller repeat protein [Theionarchaea archaeon]|nr:PQQ-binding-like beta-propeller repeat protein [Theionarchaea archaeon]
MKCVTLLSICVLCISLLEYSTNQDWPQVGHDTQHTFFSNSSVPKFLEIQWSYEVGSREEDRYVYNLSSPAVVGKRVFISSPNNLICLDLSTGEELYKVPSYARCPSTPTVDDGRLYLAGNENLFQCLNALTGDILWEKELTDAHWVNPLSDEYLYVTADNFYVQSLMGVDMAYCWRVPQWLTLVALNKETGKEIWRYSVEDDQVFVGSAEGFPILAGKTLFFYEYLYETEEDLRAHQGKSYLVCIDAHTGALKWKREGILPSSPMKSGSTYSYWMTYYKNRIYMSLKGYIMVVDIESYQQLWEYKLTEKEYAFLSVGEGIVAAHDGKWVYCLDAETGQESWKKHIEGPLIMPAMTREFVFVGSENGALHQIDIKSGEMSSYHLGTLVFSPVVANGHVLVGTSDNYIYCLGQSFFNEAVVLVAGGAGLILVAVLALRRTKS